MQPNDYSSDKYRRYHNNNQDQLSKSPNSSLNQRKHLIRQLFHRAGIININLQPLILTLSQGKPYQDILQEMTEEITPKMLRLIKQTIASNQIKDALKQIRKDKGLCQDVYQERIRQLFKKTQLEEINLQKLIEALLKQKPYNQILEQISQDILPRQTRIIQSILKSNELKKVLLELYPQQSIEIKAQKNLRAIFKRGGVQKVNLQHLITAMIKGKPYFEMIEQMTQETTPKNIRLIRQIIASYEVKQALSSIKKKHCLIEQPQKLNISPSIKSFISLDESLPEDRTIQMQVTNAQEYARELQEDNKEIPQTLIQYKLRKLEIEYANYFIQHRKQLHLNQQLRKLLDSIPRMNSSQGEKARKNIQQNKDIRRNIKILRSIICGLDMHDVFRMIDKGRQIDQTHIERIRDFDKKIKVILFLGLSKAGKTTILTRLMGYEMQKIKINGIYTVQAKNQLNISPQHKDLVIGYSSRSTTRYPRLFEIPQAYLKRRAVDDDEQVYYDQDDEDFVTYGMDCPGFQDTAGVQVQISNRITTIQALKKVDKLQIVIVINQKNWGAHGQDITKLAKTVSSIIKNYKQVRDAITFVFNQCDQQFISTLHAQIVDLFQNIKMRGSSVLDDNFKQFFKQLKEQTKNPTTILAINPITLDPHWFLKMISTKRDFIENASNCLIGDIGLKPKEQIRKYCQRCINQFKEFFSKGDLDGANYYLQMLQRVGNQQKLQSSAQYEVINMKNSIKQRLQYKITKLNVQFQQLQIVIIKDKSIRLQKLDNLQNIYTTLLKQIQQYYQISNQVQCTLESQLQSVLSQTFKFYILKMNDWKDCYSQNVPQLMDYTKMAVDIFDRFADNAMKQQFNDCIENLIELFTTKITEDFNSLSEKNQVNKNYKLYSSLKQSMGKNKIRSKFSLEEQIQQKFKQYKQSITLINMEKIKDNNNNGNNREGNWINQINDEKQGIKNIQNLLKFIKIVKKYPTQVTKKIKQEIKKISQYIIIKVPKQIMHEFQQNVKVSFQQQQQISLSLTDSISLTNLHRLKQDNNKIKNIQKLIKWLHLLNKISAIREYYGDKLIECFNGLQQLIQSQMRKFQLIKRAFNENDVIKFKRDIKKMRAQFKQLQKLTNATQKSQLINRFQQLQQDLTQSIINFVKNNDISQNILLNNIAELQKILLKYKKLREFKSIYKILSSTSELKQQIEFIIKKIGKVITQPLLLHLNEIKTKKRFQASKLSLYLQYVGVLHRQDANSSLQSQLKTQIFKLQKQTREQSYKLYIELIEIPLNSLKNVLETNIGLQDHQIDQILINLKTSFIDKCRKALRLAFEVKEKQNVKNILFSDIEITFKEFNQTLETLQLIIKQKIQFKEVSINNLDKLRKIVINLKSVQVLTSDSKEKVFDELNIIIREKIKNYQLGYQKSREQLFRQGNDPQMFEQQRFRIAYKKSLQDITEVGKKNKSQLQQFFGQYRRKVQKKLTQSNVQSIDQQEVDLKVLQFLKTTNKYLDNVKIIKTKLPEFQIQTKIKDVDILLEVLDTKIMHYFNKFKKQIMYMKSNQINKKSVVLRQIQVQIKALKQNGLKLTQFQNYKIQNKITSISEQINNSIIIRQKKIEQLKQSNKNLQKVDNDFQKIYDSLEKLERQEVLSSLQKQADQKIINLKRIYDENYKKFIQKREQFQKVLASMPKQLQKTIKNKIQKSIVKFQQQHDTQIKKTVEEGQELNSIVELAKKLQNIGNIDKIKTLDNTFKQIFNKIVIETSGDQCVPFLSRQFWQGQQFYQDVPEIIINSISKIQGRLIQKLQKVIREKWQKVFSKYNHSFRSGFDDAISEFAKSQSPNVLKKISQDKLVFIIETYCILARAKQQGRILSKQALEKVEQILYIIQQNFITFLSEGKQSVYRFQCIAKDAISNQNNIQQTFQQIRLYQKDFQTIGMSRKSELELKLRNQMLEFSKLFSTIRHTKQQIYNKVALIMSKRFVFFSDQTKNNSQEQQQQRVQTYQNNLKTLQALCNPYNNYLNPPKQITIQKTRQWIQIQTKKAVEQFQKTFNQFIYRECQVLDTKIISIPKLFKKISSKPRQFFIYCSQYQQYFTKIYRESLKNQDNQLQSLINDIIVTEESKYKQFEQFKKIQLQKLQKFLQNNRNDKIRSIKQAQRILRNKIQIEYDQKQKNKLQIELDSKLKQIQATNSKAKNHQQTKYDQKLQKFIQNRKKDNQQKKSMFIAKLLKLKRLSAIQQISTQLNSRIDDKLKKLSQFNKILQQIYDVLLASDSYIASLILDQHQIFKKFKGLKFAQQTKQTNSALIILGEMFKKKSVTNDQKQAFINYYNKLDRQQSRYIKSYTDHRDKSMINSLVLSIKSDGEQFERLHEINSGQIKQDQRISLLAKIFALWSIGSSQSQSSQGDNITICNKAHAAQIICILIILCLDIPMTSQIIKCNRLAQVKTGQGKSIVLAVLSIYFALFGYQVHCACYSNMLSKRDQRQFQKLFQLCGVKQKIHYGIFEDIIKRVLNQKDQKNHKQQTFQSVIKDILLDENKKAGIKHTDFIQKFKSFFGGFSKNTKNIKNKNKKVLIIDQIDVLFNKNYYGDTFNQSIDLKDNTITQLFWYIWKNKQNIKPQIIQNSQQFKKVIQKYKPLTQILKNQLNGMVAALSTYKDQHYLVIDKKIMYKVQDSIMDVSYSYNTIYAYLEEYQKNKISESAFNDHMGINLCVAEFSYACLPEYYNNVVGVTGTLTCLPNYIKSHLQKKYKIQQKQMFPIPSVYGNKTQNRRIFQSIICDRESHFQYIVKNMEEEFQKNRPILIFFRNKSQLLEFYNSQVFHPFQKHTSYITEQHNDFQRNQRIKISSYKQTITLLTNSFIRGTDFKLLNKKAMQHGGFHAIVTYLIDTTADYIQATGRVARQGKQGSFIEIYVDEDLQLLGISRTTSDPLKRIPMQRSKKQQKQKVSCEQKLGVSQKRHDQTIRIFLDDKFDQEKLINYVYSKNKFPVIDTNAKKARIIMIVDATGSMNTFFTQLKLFLPQIFDDVYETLQLKKINGCLEMQIVLYRNYSSPINQLLEFSTFQSQAENLKKFIKQAKTAGGWGNQAIQVALQHANAQKNINEIILIGDDRGNTIAEVKHKRGVYQQWQQQRIAYGYTETSTEKQTEELVKKNIKVSGFYLKPLNDIKLYFEKLSKQTKGITKCIDIYEKNSSAIMTQFIVERALKLIGGESGDGPNGDALVAEYKSILSKRMGR